MTTQRHTVVLGLTALSVALSACGAREMFREREDLIISESPCGARRFEIYFDEGQARLTQPARDLIAMTAARLDGCDIRRVRVLGLADARGGTDQSNLDLSEARARVVAEAFADTGWPAPAFEVQAAGDIGATTASGASQPLRRRTEVVVEAVAR